MTNPIAAHGRVRCRRFTAPLATLAAVASLGLACASAQEVQEVPEVPSRVASSTGPANTTAPPTPRVSWKQLEKANWVADGDPRAPRIVYVFTDLNCPYCNKLWADARPWVKAGRVQLRHVIVAVLSPTSAGKAAALFSAADPVKAFREQEAGHARAAAETIRSGDPQPLEEGGIKPLGDIPAALQAKIDANNTLMAAWGLEATPGIVWREDTGEVRSHTGAPPSLLRQVLGPL